MTMGPTLWGIPEGRNSKNKEMGACRTCLGDQIAMSRGPRARGRKRQKLKSENFMSGQFIKHLLGVRAGDMEAQRGGILSVLFTTVSPVPRKVAGKQEAFSS